MEYEIQKRNLEIYHRQTERETHTHTQTDRHRQTDRHARTHTHTPTQCKTTPVVSLRAARGRK